MHAGHALVIAALSLATLAAPAAAQRADGLTAGTRIRVTLRESPERVVGTFTTLDSAGLALRRSARDSAFVVPLDAVRSLEVSTRRRSDGEAFRRGALPGFLIGAAVGFVATGLAYRADLACNDCMVIITPYIAVMSLGLTGVTTLLGGVLGMSSERDVWAPAAVPER